MKCLIRILSLYLFFLPSVQAKHYQYVIFNYNIASDGNKLSDKECKRIFSEPVFYDHTNDKPQYAKNKRFNIRSYQRTNVTFLSDTQRLFSGISQVSIMGQNNNNPLKEYSSFLLDMPAHHIVGHWRIPNYCRGNLMGTEQDTNHWPNHHA